MYLCTVIVNTHSHTREEYLTSISSIFALNTVNVKSDLYWPHIYTLVQQYWINPVLPAEEMFKQHVGVRLLSKQTLWLNQERGRLTFDHWMMAAVVPLVRAVTAVKCHCQLLFCGCHGLCEIHFLCLNTFCQERKTQTQIVFAQFLTGSIWQQMAAWPLSQMRHPSVLGPPAVFHKGFIPSLH